MIEIIVSPKLGKPGHPSPKKALFVAKLVTGRVLGAFSAPLCSSARVLLSEGVPSDTCLQMRHEGSETIALKSTVGAAARLTVKEDGGNGTPRFVRFREFAGIPPSP
jgi:hypothetical protein